MSQAVSLPVAGLVLVDEEGFETLVADIGILRVGSRRLSLSTAGDVTRGWRWFDYQSNGFLL
jgi:hypothetical protein